MSNIITEQYLPAEAVKKIRRQLIPYFQARLKARRLLPKVSVDKITRQYAYDIDLEDTSQEAEIIFPGGDFPRDSPEGVSRITAMIQKIGRGYKIPYEDYINDTFTNRQMFKNVRKVAKKDDDLIINGDAVGGVVGLADIPCAAESTGAGTWADASDSGGTPYHDCIALLAKLREESDKGFGDDPKALTLVIDPIVETTLYFTHLAEASKGQVTYERLSKLFGRVEVIPTMSTGHVILMESGPEIGELIVAEDITVERGQWNIRNQSYLGNIYERVVPVWYRHGGVAGKSTAVVEIVNALA